MVPERVMNDYYNRGGFNRPSRIGYVMNMIRNLQPITCEEWRIWYLEHVHDLDYLWSIAREMYDFIPRSLNVTAADCFNYICDVMFRRTFEGYAMENRALKLLHELISPAVEKSPALWDTYYFIDFYVRAGNGSLIGIQLKPESFFNGKYQDKVDIEEKMKSFCRDMNANAFILMYRRYPGCDRAVITNPQTLNKIRNLLQAA